MDVLPDTNKKNAAPDPAQSKILTNKNLNFDFYNA